MTSCAFCLSFGCFPLDLRNPTEPVPGEVYLQKESHSSTTGQIQCSTNYVPHMTTPQYGWDTDFYSPSKNSRKGHIVKFQNSEPTSHLLGTFHFVEYLQIYKWGVGGWGPTMGQLKHG